MTDQDVRYFIYCHLADTGRAPTITEASSALQAPAGVIADAYRRLHDRHAIFL